MLFSYVQACQNECTHASNKELQKAATAFLDILLLQAKAPPPLRGSAREIFIHFLFPLSLVTNTHSFQICLFKRKCIVPRFGMCIDAPFSLSEQMFRQHNSRQKQQNWEIPGYFNTSKLSITDMASMKKKV